MIPGHADLNIWIKSFWSMPLKNSSSLMAGRAPASKMVINRSAGLFIDKIFFIWPFASVSNFRIHCCVDFGRKYTIDSFRDASISTAK